MKKLFCMMVAAMACCAAFGQGAGRGVYKPGASRPVQGNKVHRADYNRAPSRVAPRNVYDRAPGYGGHVAYAPFSIGLGSLAMPYGQRWAIGGMRLNLGLPGWTSVYQSVYGLDIGLSGESINETAGVAVNAFNNTTRDFYGVAIAGLWNRSYGRDTQALQIASLCNFAETLDGVQIGLFNRAHELHGLQIGLYNSAATGGGLQIGLWNDNASGMGSPLVGIVF